MDAHPTVSAAIGYTAGPVAVAMPWIEYVPVTIQVIVGILAAAWYIRQLYKDFKKDKPK